MYTQFLTPKFLFISGEITSFNSTTVPTRQIFFNLLISRKILFLGAVRPGRRGGLVRHNLSHFLSQVVSGETNGRSGETGGRARRTEALGKISDFGFRNAHLTASSQ